MINLLMNAEFLSLLYLIRKKFARLLKAMDVFKIIISMLHYKFIRVCCPFEATSFSFAVCLLKCLCSSMSFVYQLICFAKLLIKTPACCYCETEDTPGCLKRILQWLLFII